MTETPITPSPVVREATFGTGGDGVVLEPVDGSRDVPVDVCERLAGFVEGDSGLLA